MIQLKDLRYRYSKDESLFDDLSLEIQPGKILGLLGKNGSGKTTLIKMICGLLFPESGHLQVMGHTPSNRQPEFLRQVYLIPEEFHLPSVSIRKYIQANCGFYPSFSAALMDELLDTCELDPSSSLNRISFGERKKFLITFALATKCRLLLLDEPTNGLDIPSKSIFRKIVAGSLDDNQLVIISTHQVRDIENLIDSLIILDQGKIVMNKELIEVSSHLHFSERKSLEGTEFIYSEAIPGGFKVVSPNPETASSIDIGITI